MRDHVRFFLNGQPRAIRGDDVFITVTDFLRGRAHHMGTKVVCAEGDCGACTVLVGRSRDSRIVYEPIDACIQFMHQIDGTHIVTIEGLTANGAVHPAQQSLVDHHGSQCGYCTPGFVMALAGWAEAGCPIEPTSPRISLTGNLCRCTGYQAIFEAADGLSKSPPPPLASRFPNRPTTSDLSILAGESLRFDHNGRIYFAPRNLAEAIAFKAEHRDAVVVAGATELGVLRNKRGYAPTKMLSLSRITALDALEQVDGEIRIGANVNWTRIEQAVRGPLPEFHRVVQRFGSPQIRNAGTLAGNVANGSPIADSLALLSVLEATVEIAGPRGIRRRSINGFYTGYKKKDLAADELITRINIPLPVSEDRLRLIKVSRRFDLDIATFGSAIRIREMGGTIREAAVAMTGVAPTVLRLPKTEQFLFGQPFKETTFRDAGRIARSEIRPIDDVRGSLDFRLQLAENALVKFWFQEMEALPTST